MNDESSSSVTSNAQVAAAEVKAIQRQTERKKNKGIPMNDNMTQIDIIRYSLIDNIYLITSQPSSFQKIVTLYSLLGQAITVEESCRILGCYSFDDFLRKNQHYFDRFLEIFVTKSDKKSTSTNSELLLNYYNKEIHYQKALKKSMKEALEDEFQQLDPHRFKINLEDTKYFEYHNSIEYIDGRKNFVKVLEECQKKMFVNESGYVPVNKFQEVCQSMFYVSCPALLKLWFPKCSGMENIMRRILFEDITCSFSSQQAKKENQFRIKDGCTFEEIYQNLNSLKEDITNFHDTVYRSFGDDGSSKNRISKHDRLKRYIRAVSKKDAGCFVDSDEETDKRIENSKYNDINQRVGGTFVPLEKKKTTSEKLLKEDEKTKEYSVLVKKYKLLSDNDLDELDLEINDIIEVKEILKCLK